ncbi:helix-turn-helix domain-containing protein [Spirillospora sp. CA-255316]
MTCRIFLELLAREAALVEFEAPLVAARAAGAPAEELAELEATKVVALQVRSLLERRARREAELSALFDTAGDLAALRDVDAVLQAIVRRARRLLHADAAYMTFNDEERGDTYMRVTDGSVSSAFQSLRLPMGAGLGGLAAQTATTYTSADYLSDPRFEHLAFIDAAVREEGLVAILGVPMRLGAKVIGVLYAANRSPRPFAPEEATLLDSLAAHAAIAIDNARLLAETRAALEELSAASALIQARSLAVERAAQAHDRMTSLVVRGGGVEDVAAVVVDVLGGATTVLDPSGRRLATVGDIGDLNEAEVSAAARESRSMGRAVQRGQWWVATMAAGSGMLGTLVLRPPAADDGDELHAIDQRILERGALVIALLLLLRRNVSEAEARVRGELLGDLLDGRVTDPEVLTRRARLVGADLDVPMVVVVAHHDRDVRDRAVFWANAHAAAQRGLVAWRGEETALLLPGDDPGQIAHYIAHEMSAALGRAVTVGAARPIGGAHADASTEAYADAYGEARRCADALLALGRHGQGASADELGFVGLLLGGDRDVEGYLRGALGPLLDYDQRRGTALVHTLETYFATGGSMSKAAQRLHIHVNTVSQRLDRIGRILGPEWQDPERTLELQLALRLKRLRGHAPDPSFTKGDRG